jgi:hypothetical protein
MMIPERYVAAYGISSLAAGGRRDPKPWPAMRATPTGQGEGRARGTEALSIPPAPRPTMRPWLAFFEIFASAQPRAPHT